MDQVRAWGAAGTAEAIRQVAELCGRAFDAEVEVSSDGTAFSTSENADTVAVEGRVAQAVIVVRVRLLPAGQGLPAFEPLLSRLAALLARRGSSVGLMPAADADDGSPFWVEIATPAVPIGPPPAARLFDQLKAIAALSEELRKELPAVADDSELHKQFQPWRDTLAPVRPWIETDATLDEWTEGVADCLAASTSVAVVSSDRVTEALGLAVLARRLRHEGQSLGQLILPSIPARALADLARKVPARIATPAQRLTLGTNRYELSSDVLGLLASVSATDTPLVFTGRLAELQSTFHGGQGADNDPLRPVVSHLPEVPLETLVRFAVRTGEGRPAGGSAEVEAWIHEALSGFDGREARRLLPLVCQRARRLARLGPAGRQRLGAFARETAGYDETLAGLGRAPTAERSGRVQQRFLRLAETELTHFLNNRLVGQQGALGDLVRTLRAEVLGRPLHQPARYAAVGPPATGKSESAALLARYLDIPYVNIDCASLSDVHTASSQLLGSGRGIVMSHQPGRLEQVARHHEGAVVEISDLDHAPAPVRAHLGDLFLQVLERGEGQSATGAMFPCCNLILVFTLNLPAHSQIALTRGIGFDGRRDASAIRRRIEDELGRLGLTAFVSRVGSPVYFPALDEDGMTTVVTRALESAIDTAMRRLNREAPAVEIAPGAAAEVLRRTATSLRDLGVRAALREARQAGATAVLGWESAPGPVGRTRFEFKPGEQPRLRTLA